MDTIRPTVGAAGLEQPPALSRGVDLPLVLDAIVRALAQLAPGTHVGICAVNAGGAIETLAGTGRLVFALDNIQQHLGEGPGLTVLGEDHTVIVDDAESEHRWPSFMPYAVDLGLRSYLGVSISIENTMFGGLSLYSTTHTRLDVDRLLLAKLFAAQAAMAMRHARRETDLVLALSTSRTTGKAVGIVMERFDLDDDEGFAYLARLSQRTNIKLRDIAAHFVRQSNDLRHLDAAATAPQASGIPSEESAGVGCQGRIEADLA